MKYYTATITDTYQRFSTIIPSLITDNVTGAAIVVELLDTVNSFALNTTASGEGFICPKEQVKKIYEVSAFPHLYIKSSAVSSSIKVLLHEIS